MNNTMKKGIMLLALAALVAGGAFAQRVGDTASVFGSNWTVQSVSGDTVTLRKAQGTTFTSISAFKTWLDSQPTNTAASAYNVKVNISNMGGQSSASGSLGNVLRSNANKHVNLDLSNSTFDNIDGWGFSACTTLTGVTLPDSLTTIGQYAFPDNLTSITIPKNVTRFLLYALPASLTSITFQGTIPSGGVGANVFPQDLRAKYFAANGGPGTYTRAGTVWTKQ